MTTLDSILESNGFFDGCPAPLWKIKVNDEQYNSLKEYLVYRYSVDGHFNSCPKEAALFFAEWWKRDSGELSPRGNGDRKFSLVYNSLGLPHDEDAAKSLFENAQRIFDPRDKFAYIPGAKLVITGHGREFLYSLFYQGGFPLGKASARGGSSWRNLIKKFVRKNYDFSDLKYGAVIAKKALREYKDYLVTAAREHKPEGMPFVCDEGHPWYRLAVEGVTEGDREREARPFHIKWFLVKRATDFDIRGTITGPSELSERFVATHPEIESLDSVSLQLYRDDEYVDTLAEYEKSRRGTFVSYYDINTSIIYDGHSKYTLRIPGIDKSLLSSDVDMNIPHSFFRSMNGQDYELGSKFGERVSLLVYDDSFDIVEAKGNHTAPVKTSYKGKPFCLVTCFATDEAEVTITLKKRDGDEQYTFGSEHIPTWTEVEFLKSYNPLIIENLYDFSDPEQVRVLRFSDDESEGDAVGAEDVYFRTGNSSKWSNEIPFGRVNCTVIKDGVYSSPVNNLISVGPSFIVEVVRSVPGECHYKISWDQGEVHSADGKLEPDTNGIWVVKKTDYENSFPLSCIPKVGEPFFIHVRARYKDFSIYTPAGEKLKRYEIIPWSEVNSYRYIVRDSSSLDFKCGAELRKTLPVSDNRDKNPNALPSEGSLGLILTQDVLKKAEWRADDGYDFAIRYCDFTLQRFPLQPTFDCADRRITLRLVASFEGIPEYNYKDRTNILDSFKGHLLLLDPDGEILHDIPRDEDGTYSIPILTGKVLIVSNQRGFVRPMILDGDVLRQVRSNEEYESAFYSSKLDDKCWNAAERFLDAGLRFGLPLTDLPWINSVIKNPSLLLSLYCRMYIKAESDPGAIREVRNRLGRLITLYKIPILQEADITVYQAVFAEGIFQQQYESWLHAYGKNSGTRENFEEFRWWAAGKVQEQIMEMLKVS